MQLVDLTSVIPFVAVGLFIIVFGMILISLAKGVGEWTYNNSQPVVTVPARIIAKRSELRGRMNSGHPIRTVYFVTFELQGGERAEFGVGGKEFGLLAEEDEGQLTYQGSRYHSFERGI